MTFSSKNRFHDKIYENEDHFTNPKEYFKKAIEILNGTDIFREPKNELSFLDIGCAAGDFLRYINTIHKSSSKNRFFGIDVMSSLLKEAKTRFPEGKFKRHNVGTKNSGLDKLFNQKFDVITMFGVHSIFDDLNFIDNVLKVLKPKGYFLIYGIFNPYPYDVLMRVKKSKNKSWETGWNVHSIESIHDICQKNKLKFKYVHFEPDIEISRNPQDNLRTWTLKLSDENNTTEGNLLPEKKRKRLFTNATRIIHDWGFILINN